MNSTETGVNQLSWLCVLWFALTVSDVAGIVILTAVQAPISWKFNIVHPLVVVGWIGLAVAFVVSRRNAKAAASAVSDASGEDDLTPVG